MDYENQLETRIRTLEQENRELKIKNTFSEEDINQFLIKHGWRVMRKNPKHVPGQGYSGPEYVMVLLSVIKTTLDDLKEEKR